MQNPLRSLKPLGSWCGSNSKGKMELLKVHLTMDLAREGSWENMVISEEQIPSACGSLELISKDLGHTENPMCC